MGENSSSYLQSLSEKAPGREIDPQINNSTVADYATTSRLSPDEQKAFANYQTQFEGNTGMLPANAYYPDLHHNTAVGGYSGSIVGSNTLFAPGGGLMPLGMMDARDAAVQRASIQRQKELDDWMKVHQAPTTKHVSVQKDLTNSYITGLQKYRQRALKQSNGNPYLANKILDNDANFQMWNKGMQDTAKYHDAIIEHSSQLHADEKDHNLVLSPETKRMNADLLSGIAYQKTDPFSPEAQNTHQKFLASQASYDLDKAVNAAIDKAIPTIEQLPPLYTSRGKNETATYLEKEYFTPEQRDAIIDATYNQLYKGTDVTRDMVARKVNGMLGEKIKRKTDTYDKWHKPDKEDEGHKVSDISNESDAISGNVLISDGTTRPGEFESFDRLTLKKPVKIILPVGTKAVNLKNGSVPDKNIENVEAEIGGIYNARTYKSIGEADKGFDGMMLDKKQMADEKLSKHAVVTPMVTLRYKTKNAEGDDEVVSTQVPLVSVENSLSGSKGQNKEVIAEIKKRAEKLNAGTAKPTPEVKKTKKDPLGLGL